MIEEAEQWVKYQLWGTWVQILLNEESLVAVMLKSLWGKWKVKLRDLCKLMVLVLSLHSIQIREWELLHRDLTLILHALDQKVTSHRSAHSVA